MKNLDDLVKYVYKKYSYPKSWWSKAHFKKRCIEIHACEQVIIMCLDRPFEEPKEVIADYMLTIAMLIGSEKNINVKKMLNIVSITLDDIYEHLN